MKLKSVSTSSSREIESIIEHSLSQPGIKTGQRLRPERELATIMNVKHSRLRRALDGLVAKRLLIRRHGSGTYVRKAGILPSDVSYLNAVNNNGNNIASLPTDFLLAGTSATDGRCKPNFKQEQLDLGLWTDVYWNNESHQLIIAGMIKRAKELGHRISIHSMVSRNDCPLDYAEMVKVLAQYPSDGYLVAGQWAQLFMEALRQEACSVIFFGSMVVPKYEPYVIVDLEKAIEWAIEILADEGYRRIALLTVGSSGQSQDAHKFSYESAVCRCGLDYQTVIHLPKKNNIGAADALERLLNNQETTPDAIYVNDDFIMDEVSEVLEKRGLTPGRDFGVIVLSNRQGHPLPGKLAWSCLEFDSEQYGEILVERLVAMIQKADTPSVNLSVHARWRPGVSHCRKTDINRK